MTSQQPRITLRPPPHRDFLHGYPGIPASDPATESGPKPDPLIPLPHVLRPQAHLSGTVEVRAPLKGVIRARWLSVELEKIETVPATSNTDGSSKAKAAEDTRREGRYVELIGVGPNKLWEAGVNEGTHPSRPTAVDPPRKRGFKGIFSKSSKAAAQEEDDHDDGYDLIPDGNYPFSIPLPEGLPPTIEVDSKYNGIAYQIVASLCVKGKKGLIKGPAKPSIIIASASILLNKADILPTWPAYQPILPSPLPPMLPWAAAPGEPTVGETREARMAIRRPDGTAGEVWIKATRPGLAFGPGDTVQVFVQMGWGGERPIKLTRLEAILRETITYRDPSATNQNYIVRGQPRVSSLFTATAAISADSEDPEAFAVLYGHVPATFELQGVVPNSHTRMTVRTAKHVDVAYHLKVRALIEGGEEVAIDHWPTLIGNCDSRTAKGIMLDIGWVEGLCDRPGLASHASAASPTVTESPGQSITQAEPTSHLIASAPHNVEQLPPAASPIASYQEAAFEKSRLLQDTYGPTGSEFHVANPSPRENDRTGPPYGSSASPAQLPAPVPARTSFAPLPNAEAEQQRYHRPASREWDAVRSFDGNRASSLVSSDRHFSEMLDTPTGEDDPVSFQRAAILRRHSRDELSRPRPSQFETSPSGLPIERGPTFATAHLAPTRSNTIMAFSGSDISVTPSGSSEPYVPPPVEPTPPRVQPTSPVALLGRSLTSAEAEKRRLFLEAKEMARKRQEEARLELERQNQALAELEFEEAQSAYEARLIAEAEEERREVERLAREAFEADRLERIKRDEEKWQREEEERQAQARREMEEKRRRAEEAMQEELRRFQAQHAQAERARAAEIERQAEERKREDDAKRAMAEEMRRLDEERAREEQERKLAAARKVEMERQRADAERRRQEGEQARLADVARRRAEEAEQQRRIEAEQERLRAQARQAEEEAFARRRLLEEERLRREEEDRRRYQEEEERRARDLQQGNRYGFPAGEDRQHGANADSWQRESTRDGPSSAYGQATSQQQPAFPVPAVDDRTPSFASGVQRAPSVASFAPSTSAADATAEFYAQAIGQQSGLSDEKARYLAQLRERRAQIASSVPAGSGSESEQRSYHDATALRPAYPQHPSYPRSSATQLPVVSTDRQTNTFSPVPVSQPKPQLPAQTASYTSPEAPSSSTVTVYKTAAEEKEEAAARRRAEDAAAALRHREEDAGAPPATAPEDDEEPPSYPAPAQSGPSSSSAAQEKAELERYYSAKAAVDAQRQAPAPPARLHPAAFDRSPLTSPAPTYERANGSHSSSGPAYPSQLDRHALRASVNTVATQSDSSSHELHRDPSVAAGKRAQRAPSSSTTASDSFGYTAQASAPYSPQPQPQDYPDYPLGSPMYQPGPQRQASFGLHAYSGTPRGGEFGPLRMSDPSGFDEAGQRDSTGRGAQANGGPVP